MSIEGDKLFKAVESVTRAADKLHDVNENTGRIFTGQERKALLQVIENVARMVRET